MSSLQGPCPPKTAGQGVPADVLSCPMLCWGKFLVPMNTPYIRGLPTYAQVSTVSSETPSEPPPPNNCTGGSGSWCWAAMAAPLRQTTRAGD